VNSVSSVVEQCQILVAKMFSEDELLTIALSSDDEEKEEEKLRKKRLWVHQAYTQVLRS